MNKFNQGDRVIVHTLNGISYYGYVVSFLMINYFNHNIYTVPDDNDINSHYYYTIFNDITLCEQQHRENFLTLDIQSMRDKLLKELIDE